jgi:hypothetical protein
MEKTTLENWLQNMHGKSRYDFIYGENTAIYLPDGQILSADVYDDYFLFYLTSKDLKRDKQLFMIGIDEFNTIPADSMARKIDAAIDQAGTV